METLIGHPNVELIWKNRVVLSSNVHLNTVSLNIVLLIDLTRKNQKVLSSMRLKDPKSVEKAWSYEGKLFLRRKGAHENELVTYAQFDEWLNLPWPKK